MITAKERIEAFEKEFKALLQKHRAEINIETDEDRNEYMCLTMSTIYDYKGDFLAEYARKDYGTCLSFL